MKKRFKKTRRGGGFLLNTDKKNLEELLMIIYSMMDDFNKTFRKKKYMQDQFNKFIDNIVHDVNETNIDKLKRAIELYIRELDKKYECLSQNNDAKCNEEISEIKERIKKLANIITEYENNMSKLTELQDESYIPEFWKRYISQEFG